MRFLIINFLFLLSIGCFAQSKKDSLFGGKMKVDSALLIQSKGNPQYTKPDTISKTQPTTGTKTAPATTKKTTSDSLNKTQPGSVNVTETDSVQNQNNSETPVLKYQDNAKTWKRFVDQNIILFNKEVLPEKKIKRGTYTIMLDYEIGTDGVVSTKSVTCMPENGFLVGQINERMMPNAPQLAPLIRNGVAVKSSKRQMLVFTKEKN